MKKFKILSKELIIDEPYCQIEKQEVLTHTGQKKDWFIRQTADAVIIIPFFKTGEVLLQKTYKHGAQKFIVEFPAGMIDMGESPIHAAARELREETGLISKKITKIGSILADPTGSPMRYHFFVAENCQAIAEQELDLAEQIETFLVKNFSTAKDYLLSTMQPKELRDNKLKKLLQTSTATIAALPFIQKFLEKTKSRENLLF